MHECRNSDGEIALGVIGLGSRAAGVYRSIHETAGGRVRLAAYQDPDAGAPARARSLPGGTDAKRCRSFGEVVHHPEVNAVLVGSPNAFHVGPAVCAMEARKPLYLEKPLGATLRDHCELVEAERRTDARVVIGFVLRYTPFYRTIKKLVEEGRIGRTLYLQASEHMSIPLTADCYLRGWRAQRAAAGPLLLEKCCHDVDIINWVMSAPCETVWAVMDRTAFVPRADRPSRCAACPDEACAYRAGSVPRSGSEAIYGSEANDRCVYNSEKDIADHTTLLARYRGGVHVSFNVTMGVARGARRIRIVGTKGMVSGCAEENFIEYLPLRPGAAPEPIRPEGGEGPGHYGGEGALAREFVRVVSDPRVRSRTNIAAGFESGLICLAADEAARTGVPVVLDRYRRAAGEDGEGGRA